MKRLFKQFSFPGGIPSHVAPETPGSIHEGGELGYALSHAYGAAFDNPDLIVACVVGDGEAETGPLATGWHGNKFLNPARDGCVLPILHLNGYKIANPCFLARIPEDELRKFFEGMGYKPYFVEGREPQAVHQQLADVMDACVAEIKQIWAEARAKGAEVKRPAWPMIVFRTPKGWTCPPEIDGKKCEDYWRSHQVPMGDMDKPDHIKILEQWMKSYKPEELFDAQGKLKSEIAELAPKGHRRMSDNPHANGGLLLRDLKMPDFRAYEVKVTTSATACVRIPSSSSASTAWPAPSATFTSRRTRRRPSCSRRRLTCSGCSSPSRSPTTRKPPSTTARKRSTSSSNGSRTRRRPTDPRPVSSPAALPRPRCCRSCPARRPDRRRHRRTPRKSGGRLTWLQIPHNDRAGRAEVPVPGDQEPGPDRTGPEAVDEPVEGRPERLRHHV